MVVVPELDENVGMDGGTTVPGWVPVVAASGRGATGAVDGALLPVAFAGATGVGDGCPFAGTAVGINGRAGVLFFRFASSVPSPAVPAAEGASLRKGVLLLKEEEKGLECGAFGGAAGAVGTDSEMPFAVGITAGGVGGADFNGFAGATVGVAVRFSEFATPSPPPVAAAAAVWPGGVVGAVVDADELIVTLALVTI